MSSSSVSNRNKFAYVGWSKTMYGFESNKQKFENNTIFHRQPV